MRAVLVVVVAVAVAAVVVAAVAAVAMVTAAARVSLRSHFGSSLAQASFLHVPCKYEQ